MKGFGWSKQDIHTLIDSYAAGERVKVIAAKLGRSVHAIEHKARALDIHHASRSNYWSREEIDILALYPRDIAKLAEHLPHRTYKECRTKAANIKLWPASRNKHKWTRDELLILETEWKAGTQVKDIATILNIPETLVKSRREKLLLPKRIGRNGRNVTVGNRIMFRASDDDRKLFFDMAKCRGYTSVSAYLRAIVAYDKELYEKSIIRRIA